MHPWTVTVQDLHADTIVIRLPNGQTIEIPKTAVYGTPKAGQELRLIGVVPGSEDAGQQAFAARLVNEILGKS